MFKSKLPITLSFQDRYILAFEEEHLPFNSHLILEFSHKVDNEKLKETFLKLFEMEPMTRIVPDAKAGLFYQVSFSEIDIEKQFFIIKQNAVDHIWNKKFDSEQEASIRLYKIDGNEKDKIVFSFHHSVFDGHAQFNYLKDFLDVYNDYPNYQSRSLEKDIYRFRNYFKTTSLKWLWNFFHSFIKNKKREKSNIARLCDKEPDSRIVDTVLIELERNIIDKSSRKALLSSSAYVSLIGAKALDKLLSERGNFNEPIVLYITKSMRFELKIMRHYQNLLGFIWMKIDRKLIKEKEFDKHFRETYKFRSSDDEIRKTLLGAAIIVKLKSFIELKKILKYKEQKVHDCTLIISSGRTPTDLKFPDSWDVTKLYAKGSMHRSPGIGLMVTGYKNKDFIVIEYLRDAFNTETINRFKELILEELS